MFLVRQADDAADGEEVSLFDHMREHACGGA